MIRTAVIVALALPLLPGCKRTEKKSPASAAPTGERRIVVDDGQVWARVVPERVTQLDIRHGDAPPVVLVSRPDGWHLTAPVADRADARALQFALNELRQLEWTDKPVTDQPSAYDEYKIGPGDAVTVRITENGAERPPLVLGVRQVARIGDSPDVYRIHNLSYFTFARELRFWRDRTVTRFAPDAITRLELLDDRKGHLVLERAAPPAPAPGEAAAPGAWKVVRGGKVDLARAEAVYRRLQDLEAADIATASVADAGLERPRLSILAHTAGGVTRLDIGAATADGGAYARVDGGDRVLILGDSAVRAVAAPLAAWRAK